MIRQCVSTLTGLFILTIAAWAQTGSAEVSTLDGARLEGDIRSLTANGVEIAPSGGAARQIPAASIVAIQFRKVENTTKTEPAPANLAQVEFDAGDVLVGALSGGGGDRLQLTLAGQSVPIPIEAVRKVLFPQRVPRGIVAFAPAKDGDRLYRLHRQPGQSEPVVEAVHGTLSAFGEKSLEFEGVLGKANYAYEDLAAIVLATLPSKGAAGFEPAATLSLIPDGRLRVKILQFTPATLQVDAGALGSLQIPVRAIAGIRYKSPAFVDLSDLEPSEVVETPWFGGEPQVKFPWKRNRSVVGTPLAVAGVLYESGLGVHSRSYMVYDLGGSFKSFRAKAGIDDSTLALPRRGSVIFRIHVDGKKAWESGVVRTGERAVAIPEIALTGAKKLALEVDYADGFDVADRADWCDAILLRSNPSAAK
jgi:hypothetical protein